MLPCLLVESANRLADFSGRCCKCTRHTIISPGTAIAVRQSPAALKVRSSARIRFISLPSGITGWHPRASAPQPVPSRGPSHRQPLRGRGCARCSDGSRRRELPLRAGIAPGDRDQRRTTPARSSARPRASASCRLARYTSPIPPAPSCATIRVRAYTRAGRQGHPGGLIIGEWWRQRRVRICANKSSHAFAAARFRADDQIAGEKIL